MLNPETRLGPDEIPALLGAGGMGDVHQGRDTRLERLAAIKILPAHLAERPDLRERFEREANANASGQIARGADSSDNGAHGASTMLTQSIQAAMRKAKYEILPEDGSFYGGIPGFAGVWANAANLEACREELEEVLEEWLLRGIARNHPLPVVDGIELTIKETA